MSDGFHHDCGCGEPGSHALAELFREQQAGALTDERAKEIVDVARADGVPLSLVAATLSIPLAEAVERFS